jgi:hypothetical protein
MAEDEGDKEDDPMEAPRMDVWGLRRNFAGRKGKKTVVHTNP